MSGLDLSEPRTVKRRGRTARPDGEQHSARVGAAQDLMALNMDLPSVMQAGRWRDTRMPMRYGESISGKRSDGEGGEEAGASLEGV
jgi:hypothetical protein